MDETTPPRERKMTDVATLRARARRHIEEGAVTPGYTADRAEVVKLLNEALATEIVCTLRYRRHYFMARGIHAATVAAEFREHADEELRHADQIAERIVQLGGDPDFNPNGLTSRSHSEYREGADLEAMIKEDLIAERVAIESYREMIDFIKDHDHTTRRMLERILEVEEEHAEELTSMLKGLASLSPAAAGAG